MIKAEFTCPTCDEKFLSELELNKHLQGVCTKGQCKAETKGDETPLDKIEEAIELPHTGYEQEGHSELERTR